MSEIKEIQDVINYTKSRIKECESIKKECRNLNNTDISVNTETHKTILQALTEKLEREQGCESCKSAFIYKSRIGFNFENARFCPMCGRRLQNE